MNGSIIQFASRKLEYISIENMNIDEISLDFICNANVNIKYINIKNVINVKDFHLQVNIYI